MSLGGLAAWLVVWCLWLAVISCKTQCERLCNTAKDVTVKGVYPFPKR